jgi:hypothetical protein
VAGLHVTDRRLDSGAPSQFTSDRRGDAALLA